MFKKNHKKVLTVAVVILMFLILCCGCSEGTSVNSEQAEIVPQEFKLLSAYIEMRPLTNNFGGILRTDEYFHYSFSTDSGKVIFEEIRMPVDFELGDENKILQYGSYRVFIMTEEMYSQVFTAK